MTKQSEKSPEIAFYIGLKNVKKSIEDADLNIGNPGVGGTQYLFLLTVKKYNEKYNETKLFKCRIRWRKEGKIELF